MAGRSRVAAASAEHARKIAERAVTVLIHRVTKTRDRGNLVETPSDVGPVTIGVYLARTSQALYPPTTPGRVEKSQAFGALLPVVLDDGLTPLYPTAADMPNDPNTTETFVTVERGKLTIEHVYPVTIERVVIGYQADVEEEK